MTKYDLTVLLKTDIKEDGKEKFIGKIEKLVKALGGKVEKETEMGKKQLAYKIDHLSEATFLSWILELPGSAVVELEKKLTVDKEIIRHLLVVAE
jgi:small subunit ribosomal protein S6